MQAYNLGVLPDNSAEVWIVSEYQGNPAGSEKLEPSQRGGDGRYYARIATFGFTKSS